MPFPFGIIPYFEFIQEFVVSIQNDIVLWVGDFVLQIEEPILVNQNGSGDKLYNYILLLILFLFALLGTFLWTILFNRKEQYKKLNYWFVTYVRFFLGYTMVYYGMFKILPIQFGEIAFWRLLQPYGDSSPMGLAWTFLGHSKGYNIFMGLSEFVGGVLLFHRKTKLMGSLILIPIITNIVAINFFYDIPVKLFSLELLLMAVILVLPDFKRILNLIIFNKTIESIQYQPPFKLKKWTLTAKAIKWSFVLLILFNTISKTTNIYSERKEKSSFYGLYEVTHFIRNSDTILPILTDKKRWRYLFFEYPNTIQFSRMDKSRYGYKSEIDTIDKKIRLESFNDSTEDYLLNYKITDSTLLVNGVFRKDTILCNTKKLRKQDFLLTSRGFHWINEYPYNR